MVAFSRYRIAHLQRPANASTQAVLDHVPAGSHLLVIGGHGHDRCAAVALHGASAARVSFYHPDPVLTEALGRRASRMRRRDRIRIHQRLVAAPGSPRQLAAPKMLVRRSAPTRWWQALVGTPHPDAVAVLPCSLVDLVGEERPDVVVLDVGTPEVALLKSLETTGPESSQPLRPDRAERGVRAPVVIMMTRGAHFGASATAVNASGALDRGYTLKVGLDMLVLSPPR
jgi:hypothetical protein